MLKLKKTKRLVSTRTIIGISAAGMLLGGLYLLSLVAAPAVAPLIALRPINVDTLPAPKLDNNRIIIPKLGVDIIYGKGAAALDSGAEWRAPSSGNPRDGSNFVIAAHRFSIQPTPQSTIEKSPFYRIDQLVSGDKIIIDFEGKRYGYEVEKKYDVKATDVQIEAPTTDARLTLYSCELGGSEAGRVVIQAKRLGEVALAQKT